MLEAKAGCYLDTSQRGRGSVIKENGGEVADEGDETREGGCSETFQYQTEGCILYYPVRVCAKLLQSCLTVCDPMDCSPPGSSVHGILQSSILEWTAMPSSRGSS